MGSIFTVIIIIACVGLVLFVLVQNPKGGGLNSEFGSAVQLGGAKRATDILEKGTWGLAILLAVICLAMANPGEEFEEGDEQQGNGDVIEEFNAPDEEEIDLNPGGGFQLNPNGAGNGQ
mgnify:CR=1 FL=1|jgi:preprotein translocase subunit SecG